MIMIIKTGIYVHIPFCESKCFYCNFVSANYSAEIKEKYIEALFKEIETVSTKRTIYSIFIGGGTPSVLDAELIVNLLEKIRSKFKISKNAEITIECNPNSLNYQKLKAYKKAGINRISIGIQSLDDGVLKLIGRRHNKSRAIQAIKMAKDVGFNNINVDLLIGITKNKTIDGDVLFLKKLGVTHISAYMLILEKDTALFEKVKNGTVKLLSEDESIEQYNEYLKTLRKYGFKRYEISNFCLKGFECKHNINYWECGEYYGFGVSAHSYIDGVRYFNTDNILKYLDNFNNKVYEKLTDKEKIEELIMLGLRMTKGVNLLSLKALGYNILENKNALKMLSLNLIKINKRRLYITYKNFGIANQIILKLI